jgi:hypothetical protein
MPWFGYVKCLPNVEFKNYGIDVIQIFETPLRLIWEYIGPMFLNLE